MIGYARIYNFYKTPFFKLVRIALLLGVLLWSINQQASLLFFSVFLSLEIFFHFKIKKVVPKTPVSLNNGDVLDSFTLPALSLFLKRETGEIIKSLFDLEPIQFMLSRSDIEKEEIQLIEVQKDELKTSAFNLVKEIGGKYITSMDLFAAYLLMTEKTTKLLFSKKLKDKDFFHILQWARFDYKAEENPPKIRVDFWGEGIGELWVYGWTLETKKYTVDLTSKARAQKLILIGRRKEYQSVIEGLSKKEKNNILLVGETGSGKTTIVENLAFRGNKRVLQLMVGSLLAGMTTQGDLEKRLENIIEELLHAGNVILFIPELQNVLGDSAFKTNLFGTFLPYLKEGAIPIIASMTPSNYKSFVEEKPDIKDVFEIVKLEEPDLDMALQMLLEKAQEIERQYKVSFTYKAILAGVNFAARFMHDRILPGSAVVLISDTANRISFTNKKIVEEEDIIKTIEEKTKIAVGQPSLEEKNLLLNFEEQMHKRIIDQEEAVHLIGEALRRIRSGLSAQNKPISFLFLGPTGVGKTETAKALSEIYFKGENKMIRLDMSEYTTEDGVKRLLGWGGLTEKVYDNPFSLVLLDEFEKANEKIHDLFLQVLDDGRLTDNKGKTVSFADTIIIATSNAASEFIREEISKGTVIDKNFQKRLLDLLQTKDLFKPELLNRFDAVVVFKPLGEKELEEITKLFLENLTKKLSEQDISLSCDSKIISKIIKEGSSIEFGARPFKRFIQDNIEDLLSTKILKDEIKRGDSIAVSTDDAGNIIVKTA